MSVNPSLQELQVVLLASQLLISAAKRHCYTVLGGNWGGGVNIMPVWHPFLEDVLVEVDVHSGLGKVLNYSSHDALVLTMVATAESSRSPNCIWRDADSPSLPQCYLQFSKQFKDLHFTQSFSSTIWKPVS